MDSKTRQLIEIEITWKGWKKLRLNALIAWLCSLPDLEIGRITVKEIKRK